MLTRHPPPQQAVADAERLVVVDVAPTESWRNGHTDQQVSPQGKHLPDAQCSTHGQPPVFRSFELQPDETPPRQELLVVSGSFKLASDSTVSFSDQPGPLAAAERAVVAAAAESRDADADAEQSVRSAKAAPELAATHAAAAQSDPVSARTVGRSGKHDTIEVGLADQGAGDFASTKCVKRRFREFVALDMELRPRRRSLPKLPPKSAFKGFRCSFMENRKKRLGAYLSDLAADPAAVAEPSVRRFLGSAC